MSFSSSPVREQPPAIFRHMQPSSPTHYDDDIPDDVELSFASSMSISMSPAPPPRPRFSPILDASPMDISPAPTPFLQVPRRPALAAIQPAQRENTPRDYFTLNSGKKRKQPHQPQQGKAFSLPPARVFGSEVSNLPTPADSRSSLSPEKGSGKSGRSRSTLPLQWLQSKERRRGGLFGQDGWDAGLPPSSPAPTDRMEIDTSSDSLPGFPGSPAPHPAPSDEYMSPPPAVLSSLSNPSDLSGLYESGSLPSSPLAQRKKPSPPAKLKSLLPVLSPELPSSSPPSSPTVALKARKLDKFATLGSGSLHFGAGSAPGSRQGSISRRPHPYARRPSINPSAPDRDSILHRPVLPAPQSAFSILTQDPEGLYPGPPAVSGPMRRALSAAGAGEVSSDDLDLSAEGSPLLTAQRAYAKRTHTRLVTRVDGSPAFRPLRKSTEPAECEPRSAVEQGSKRESCPAQMHAGQPFAGFGHNEQEGKILPCHKVKDDGLMRITPQTLEAVLNGDYDAQLAALHIVDCRFDYEFAGGHIDGAVNLHTTDAVEDYFLQSGCGIALPRPSRSGEDEQEEKKTVIIFHCEFSVKRAPTIAKHLRSKDRALNTHCYPKVHFPEIYVLQGGYYDFFKRSPAHCEPQGYVAMLDPRHAGACSPSLGQFRQGSRWQRARSYTYGDHTMQRPKSIAQPPALPFAATAAAAAVKKRRGAAQALTSVREDHSSSEDAFGSLDSPCHRIPLPPSRPPSFLDPRPKSLVGRTMFERAVSFRQ